MNIRGGAGTRRLADDEHIPRTLWFFAGGVGRPPTGAEMRDWKRRDREWKAAHPEKAGFWGTFKRALFGGRGRQKESALPPAE